MTAQPLLSSTILIRVMTVFLFVLTQKRVMTAFTNNVLGLMKVMCGTRVTWLSFGTREYTYYSSVPGTGVEFTDLEQIWFVVSPSILRGWSLVKT